MAAEIDLLELTLVPISKGERNAIDNDPSVWPAEQEVWAISEISGFHSPRGTKSFFSTRGHF